MSENVEPLSPTDAAKQESMRIAEAKFATLREVVERRKSPHPVDDVERVAMVDELWLELCEYTDRTSPEEYPDHALITRGELADFIDRAALSAMPSGSIYEECARIAEQVGNFGDYKREELTADFGQPQFDLMHAIAKAIRERGQA